MTAALPAAAIVTGEYRTLTLYDAAPADCGAVLVPDDAFAPHLKAGEMAIVDPEDNEPVAGEIYLVTIASRREPDGITLRFVELRPTPCRSSETDEPIMGWMMRFGPARLSDGPLNEAGVRRKIVGRVIGVAMG